LHRDQNIDRLWLDIELIDAGCDLEVKPFEGNVEHRARYVYPDWFPTGVAGLIQQEAGRASNLDEASRFNSQPPQTPQVAAGIATMGRLVAEIVDVPNLAMGCEIFGAVPLGRDPGVRERFEA
jgi:hypothetical protein